MRSKCIYSQLKVTSYMIGIILLLLSNSVYSQDANNPIDPNPTAGLWNRFYSDEQSRLQFLSNATLNQWFFRFTLEYEFNYNKNRNEDFKYDGNSIKEGDHFNSTNFMVSRLFNSKNGKHNFGVGLVGSYFHEKNFAAGLNFVSVSKVGEWKFISLITYQTGKNISTMELQPGIYKDFPKRWYFRSHPRMLFNFETSDHEIPIGAGIGRLYSVGKSTMNFFFEPQFDFVDFTPMLYTGIKTLF